MGKKEEIHHAAQEVLSRLEKLTRAQLCPAGIAAFNRNGHDGLADHINETNCRPCQHAWTKFYEEPPDPGLSN